MKFTSLLAVASLLSLGTSELLVDYKGGQPARSLGNSELEGQDLGCKLSDAGNANYIRPGVDNSNGRRGLHFKRDPHFRRAEVKALHQKENNPLQPNNKYYIGYHFRLTAKGDHLAIFQWKKWDKKVEPQQNIPFHLYFTNDGRLQMEYTIPGTNGSNREVVWTDDKEFTVGIGAEHQIGFAIDTSEFGSLEFWLDGVKQRFSKNGKTILDNVQLFTGPTSPKFGIYRSEQSGGGPEFCPSNNIYSGPTAEKGTPKVYHSWVYRVQISNSSMDEVAEAAGIQVE